MNTKQFIDFHLFRFVEPMLVVMMRSRDPLHNSGEAVAVGSGWAARRLFAGNSHAIDKINNAA
ncbi:MAG: hypothetical protein ABIQ90_00505, partial [Polaromonas sp.]